MGQDPGLLLGHAHADEQHVGACGLHSCERVFVAPVAVDQRELERGPVPGGPLPRALHDGRRTAEIADAPAPSFGRPEQRGQAVHEAETGSRLADPERPQQPQHGHAVHVAVSAGLVEPCDRCLFVPAVEAVQVVVADDRGAALRRPAAFDDGREVALGERCQRRAEELARGAVIEGAGRHVSTARWRGPGRSWPPAPGLPRGTRRPAAGARRAASVESAPGSAGPPGPWTRRREGSAAIASSCP